MDCNRFAVTYTVFQRAHCCLLAGNGHRIDLSVAQDYISDIIGYFMNDDAVKDIMSQTTAEGLIESITSRFE